jgi:uncharacterized phage protein gp47/JayE
MSIVIKTPRQAAQEYLDWLKGLRPEVNTDQTDSDWWIRSRVVGGVAAGIYADLNRVSNDAFPQSARREAIDKHLQVWFGTGLRDATYANGNLGITGTIGATVIANTQFIHTPTAKVYVATETVVLDAVTGTVAVQSVNRGQDQNLLPDTELVLSTPIAGVNSTALAISPGVTDGRNEESTQEGAERVLARIRNPTRGGTEADYQVWALSADSRVISVRINRFVYGLGTVQAVISAGTSDIDQAIDNDESIVVQPSEALKTAVLEYVDQLNPITDVLYVDGPVEKTFDVNASVAFMSGDKDTIVPDASVSQGKLVEREIIRALYKTPIGGRDVNGVSAVRAADIEEQIDFNLSASPYTVGVRYQIVGDRQIEIVGGTPNGTLASNEVAVPGTITITDM